MPLPGLNRGEQHLFGRHIPAGVQSRLRQAIHTAELDGKRAENTLWDTWRHHPEQTAILIVIYKFYLHRGRLAEALQTIRQTLLAAAEAGGLPADWQNAIGDDTVWSTGRHAQTLYLYSLRAMSTLLLRMGDAEESYRIMVKLYELDPGGVTDTEVMRAISRDELSR